MVLPALQGAHLAMLSCSRVFTRAVPAGAAAVHQAVLTVDNAQHPRRPAQAVQYNERTQLLLLWDHGNDREDHDASGLPRCAGSHAVRGCRLLLWGRTRAHSVHARRYVKGDAVREHPPREYIYDLYAVVNQSGGAPSPHFRRRVVCLTRRASCCFAPQAWRAGTTSPTPARCPRFERRSGTTTTTRTSPRCRRMTCVRPQRTVSARARPWRPSRCARVAHAPRRVA